MHTEKSRKIGINIISEPYVIPNDCTWAGSRNGKAAIHWSIENLPYPGVHCGSYRHSVIVQWPSFSVIACYLSPNANNEEFDTLIDELEEIISDDNTNYIIGGDFNARAHLWGSKTTDYRGELLIRWAASRNVNLINEGNEPTCIRSQGSSIVDLT